MKRLLYSIFSIVITLTLTLASLAFTPTPVAYAQDLKPPTAQDPEGLVRLLERAFQRELEWSDRQQANLDKARGLGEKIQELIDQAREKGKEVSTLQAALDAFRLKLGEAQGAHDAAAAILSAHNGFDENGKVTDRQAARKTVVEARNALRKAHQWMWQSGKDLRHAVRKWRAEQNKTS